MENIQAVKNIPDNPDILSNVQKKRKIIIVAAIIAAAGLVLAIGVLTYFYWSNAQKNSEAKRALDEYNQSLQKVNESAADGVLPSLQTDVLENKPNVNPADAANPIKNIKTNPFE